MYRCRYVQILVAIVMTTSSAAFGGTEPPSKDLLAGPQVESTAMQPLTKKPRGNVFQKGGGSSAIPRAQWLAALQGLQLSALQRTQIATIVEEFRNWQRRHRTEAPSAGAPQMRPSGPQRPRPLELQQRIWNELTPKQQEKFKNNLKRIRARLAERRPDFSKSDELHNRTMQKSNGEADASTETPPSLSHPVRKNRKDQSAKAEGTPNPPSQIISKPAKKNRLNKPAAGNDNQTP